MIHYQLRCEADHAFDGWFRDSTTFDTQAKAGLVECPQCGERRVRRALMAPALSKHREMTTVPATPLADPPAPMPSPPPRLPDQVRAVLQRIRVEIERRCDYVGPTFADEARRIHNGQSEQRGIYGEATPEEAEALAEDGIEVGRIPWVPLADA